MPNALYALRSYCRCPAAVVASICLLLAACTAPAPSLKPADVPFGQGRIWQVEGDGILRSYVFGTMHSTNPRLRDLPAEVPQALDAAGTAAFELADSRKARKQVAEAVLLPTGQRLEDILGPDLFRRTAETVAPLGVPAVGLQRLKAWALVGLLGLPPVELARQAQGELTLDEWLESEASLKGKTVVGLESHWEQLALFDDMSDRDQAMLVTDLVNNYGQVQVQFERLLEDYLDGNLAALMAELYDLSRTSDVAATLRFRNALIEERNRTMVERMIPLMQQESTFVAVGAGHLAGEEGILRLMEKRGFTVTRLH